MSAALHTVSTPHLVPIQPSYATTGHGAQLRTSSAVMVGQNKKRRKLDFRKRKLIYFNFFCLFVSVDNFYKVEGAKDALICGYGSDAG